MKCFLEVATVIGICALALAAYAGNLNTSARCPTTGFDCELGHEGSTSFAIITDGGTVTIDGTVTADSFVEADYLVSTAASGTLSFNRATLVTAAGDITIADCRTTNIGHWYTIIVRDASETVSISSSDASDIFYVSGLTMHAGDELDSPTAGATTPGSSITLVCTEDDKYMAIHTSGLWVDGGAT
jgi:hypothetical protein